MYEPCLCGADDCPSCFPGRVPRRSPYGLSAEDCDILNEDYRAEQAAADEEAARTFQEMLDQEQFLAEQAANAEDAERWYADNDTPPVKHDLF